MGRYYWNKKDTVENCRSVSISFLRKHDYFCGYRSGRIIWENCYGEETSSIGISVSTLNGENYVRFQYTITKWSTGEKIECDYKVQLTTTPCNFGGIRYWFICPLSSNGVYCGRRVEKLYCAPNANYYGCRHCYNLSYESRNELRLARPGGIGYPIKAERMYEELYKKTKRWTYKGKPTKKARKLKILERRMEGVLDAYDALLML
ncbi:MAG: hypothetical protein ACYTFW_04460 [Planctomycetota bacterium]